MVKTVFVVMAHFTGVVFEILLLALGCVSTERGDFIYINDCFTVIAMGYSKWHQYLYKLVDVYLITTSGDTLMQCPIS